ncbi:TetR/AcrR family transcriptional regulator [Paenibacillus sacheonensis]|uniref:TetR family transcriptional regulator n=1 Tax=Paenibacillus sacheonensis TaxID=742054 RepID=A0A7X4YN26_9BACL|nr:TetR/AcrR family transcriptional regulator [Paenibacillus sacheonensis]MBM7564864.1 TetR/AcrR family transcriptional repressor of nem operon [Paenibacillus sacheonensis]NBC69412.1 TetR family transcriptional regulator [Paenibacillus sacheonensis]
MNKNKNTAELILDTAQAIVQDVGFNGFSYSHIAEKIGIRTASIHYHFPNKEDLGEALIARYRKNFIAASVQFDNETSNNLERLRKFTLMYAEPVQDYCTCLGVMLSTDLGALSGKAGEGLAEFLTANLDWLQRVLEDGQREGQLYFEGDASVQAHLFLASLQGAQLLAKSFRDRSRFDRIANGVLSALTVK